MEQSQLRTGSASASTRPMARLDKVGRRAGPAPVRSGQLGRPRARRGGGRAPATSGGIRHPAAELEGPLEVAAAPRPGRRPPRPIRPPRREAANASTETARRVPVAGPAQPSSPPWSVNASPRWTVSALASRSCSHSRSPGTIVGVHRLGQQGVPELVGRHLWSATSTPCSHRLPQRLGQDAARAARPPPATADTGVASDGRGHAQQQPAWVEPGHARRQRSRSRRGSSSCRPAASSSSAKNGLPSDRATIASATVGGSVSSRARSSERRSARASGPSFEHQARAGAPAPVRHAAHAFGRRRLVRSGLWSPAGAAAQQRGA